jgi:6-phosphogluconolactonase (cycloisomerase 2 family)
VGVWARNKATGKLTFLQRLDNDVSGINGLEYAVALALHPDGKRLYVAAQQDNALSVFAREEPKGTLRFLEALTHGQAGVEGMRGARAVTVSPDGRNVYVGSAESPVVVFAVAGYDTSLERQRGRIGQP